jgi:hypothetical protein
LLSVNIPLASPVFSRLKNPLLSVEHMSRPRGSGIMIGGLGFYFVFINIV